MKSKIGAILAGAILAVTGATLPASAFTAQTQTLNVEASGQNNAISQRQDTMLLAKGGRGGGGKSKVGGHSARPKAAKGNPPKRNPSRTNPGRGSRTERFNNGTEGAKNINEIIQSHQQGR
jgi:hypothetical protein